MSDDLENDVEFHTWPLNEPRGGQHVGKTCTAVIAVHVPTGVAAISRDERSQFRNRQEALAKLRALVDAWNKTREPGIEAT